MIKLKLKSKNAIPVKSGLFSSKTVHLEGLVDRYMWTKNNKELRIWGLYYYIDEDGNTQVIDRIDESVPENILSNLSQNITYIAESEPERQLEWIYIMFRKKMAADNAEVTVGSIDILKEVDGVFEDYI